MTTPRPRKPLLASLVLMSVAVAATTAASKAPRPTPFVMHAPAPRQVSPPVELAMIESVAPIVATSAAPRTSVPAATPVSRVTNEIAVRPASPAKTLIERMRGPGVPIELIRAIMKMYHPNVILGDSSVNLVTIVLDHDLNYVYSSTGKTPTEDGLGWADDGSGQRKRLLEAAITANDSAAKVEMAAVRAAKESMDYQKGRALGMAYKIESRGDDVSDSVRSRYAATEKLAAEASARASKLDFINPDAIGSVEVRHFAGGTLSLFDVGVIVIVLKDKGGV